MKTNRSFSMALMLALIIALTMSAVQAQVQTKRRPQRPAGTIPPVSANPPSGNLEGKVSDVLSDGLWRFQVLSVQMTASYTMKTDAEPYDYVNLSSFDLTKRIFSPKTGYKLVLIQCRATNAQKSQKRLWVAASDTKNVRTALTDTGGSSHLPIAYDFEGGPIQTKPLGPAETITFQVIFSLPQSAQLKELIFTLAANGERDRSKDARVSLAEGTSQ